MSDEEIRIAIADAMGWEISDPPEYEDGALMGHIRPTPNDWRCWDMVPDYLSDLNAIRNAVGLMCEKHGWKFQEPYTNTLMLITQRRRQGCNSTQKYFWMAEADSRQRCEAFIDALVILNLYTESPNVETKE